MNELLDPKILAKDVRPAQNGDPDAMNRLLNAANPLPRGAVDSISCFFRYTCSTPTIDIEPFLRIR